MFWRKIKTQAFVALAMLTAAGLGVAQTESAPNSDATQSTMNNPSGGGSSADENVQFTELTGKVIDAQVANAPGQAGANKIVLVQTPDGQRITVNLGLSDALGDALEDSAAPVTIRGAMVQIGGQPVFMADRLQVGSRIFPVSRPIPVPQSLELQKRLLGQGRQAAAGPQPPNRRELALDGTIEKIEEAAVPGSSAKCRIVQVRTADGSRERVDLGPVGDLGSFKLKIGDSISVTAHSGQAETGATLLADELRVKNQMVEIYRPWNPRRGALPPAPSGQPYY
jgi:hypothetical protein